MPRKALLCVLKLDVRSITCPGVLLKDKEELYLSVSVLGQLKKTQCVPAVFPLFFQEKLVFEKAFADIVDPGDLVELLELDTAVLELIQLVPPVGKILATYEENTRDFLFPDPKLTCGHHGLDREILMKRSSSFTGIAPKLRFSTSSLITESLLSSGRSHIQGDLNWVHHSTPNGKLQTKLPKKNTLSPEKSRHSLATKNYEQPTIASKSRSPSPYTKRRMCELSEEARQRLAHLNLGPYEFRRETDKPPFVVRRVEQPSPGIKLHTWCPTQESTVEAWTKVDHGIGRILNKLLLQKVLLNSSLPHETWNIVLHDTKVGVENTKAQASALFHSTCFDELDSGANQHHSLWVCWSGLGY